MKRNFFKNSLAAFAFTLAIVASFAFSPASNDIVNFDAYIQQQSPQACIEKDLAADDDCSPSNEGPTCTITIGPNTFDLFVQPNPSQPTSCIDLLKKPEEL